MQWSKIKKINRFRIEFIIYSIHKHSIEQRWVCVCVCVLSLCSINRNNIHNNIFGYSLLRTLLYIYVWKNLPPCITHRQILSTFYLSIIWININGNTYSLCSHLTPFYIEFTIRAFLGDILCWRVCADGSTIQLDMTKIGK